MQERLAGWQFLQIADGDTPSVSLTVKRGGVVFVATAAPEELEKKGWLRQEALGFHYSDPGRTRLTVLTRRVRKDESVPIPHFSWTGTIVLIPPP